MYLLVEQGYLGRELFAANLGGWGAAGRKGDEGGQMEGGNKV